MNEIDNALHAEAAKALTEVYRFITGERNDTIKAESLAEWLAYASTYYATTAHALVLVNSAKV